MRLTALFPMACAIVAFVLGMLCLFAGHKPGFMEDYHIVTLNTSTLGHDLIPTSTDSGSNPTSTSSGIGSFFSNLAQNITDEIEGGLDDIIGDVADKLSSELGIEQWYSWHLMDFCEGTYAPDATAKGANYNVSECSKSTAMYHFDPTDILGEQLQIGPHNVSLSEINWPSNIQTGIKAQNDITNAMFIFYAIGIAAAGLAIITSLIAVFLQGSRLISLGNWGLASLSFACFLIASVMITIIQDKISDIINKYGNDIGIYAYKGGKFLAITWVAVAVMFLASIVWVAEFCIGRRRDKREYTEKSAHRTGWRHRKSDEAALRRSGV